MKYKSKKQLTDKRTGDVIPSGAMFHISFDQERPTLALITTEIDGKKYAGKILARKLPFVFDQLKLYDEGEVLKMCATPGRKVEPDGWDPFGFPSWGLIYQYF